MTTISTPTTQSIADNLVGQIDASLDHSTPFLEKTFTRVLAKAQSGVFVLLYKYAGWSLLQMFIEHASFEETTVLGVRLRPLVEHGRRIGVGDPLPATRAEHVISVPVQSQTGSLAAGAQVVNPATGVVYVTTAAVALNAATVQATIRAASDQNGGSGEGTIGNVQPGTVLQFANPLPNVARNVTVVAQTVTGANAESPTAYRARVLRRSRQRPQGGAYADYRQWAEGDAGVLNAYPYTGAPGEVDVYIEATVESSGSADGIPTNAQITAVTQLIEGTASGLATVRPANAAANVLAITRAPFDVEVTGLEVDDETSVKAAISSACDEYLRTREPFIVGLSQLPRVDRVTRAAIGGVVDDVVSGAGGSVSSVRVLMSGEGIDAYTLPKGQKAKLGTVTYVA